MTDKQKWSVRWLSISWTCMTPCIHVHRYSLPYVPYSYNKALYNSISITLCMFSWSSIYWPPFVASSSIDFPHTESNYIEHPIFLNGCNTSNIRCMMSYTIPMPNRGNNVSSITFHTNIRLVITCGFICRKSTSQAPTYETQTTLIWALHFCDNSLELCIPPFLILDRIFYMELL